MSEGEEFEGMGFDPREFFEQLRRSASVKAGAVIFGQAQVTYYETLKQSMPEERAYSLLAHTTECIFRAAAEAAGPLANAILQASFVWERLPKQQQTDKEVPGSGS